MTTARSLVSHVRTRFPLFPAPGSGNHRRRLAAGIGVAAGVAAVLTGAGPTLAQPTQTIHSVQARIDAINTQAEKLTEAYDAARGQLQAIRGKAAAAKATLRRDQSVLAGMQHEIATMARAAYETAGLSDATALLATGNPELVANRTNEIGVVAQAQRIELAKALAATRAVESDRATYAAQISAERATLASIAAKRHQIQSLLADAHRQLASLKAAQRRRLAAEAAQQRQQALAARRAYHPTYNGPASGAAAVAVKFAYAQLGKPYQWGAAGPNAYDCSGLTMAAWAAAGVSLPHNAAEQQASVPAVSLSALQPGDLVFFGSPAYHVAIYVGDGKIIQAPHTGAYVEVTPLSYMTPSGAGRP